MTSIPTESTDDVNGRIHIRFQNLRKHSLDAEAIYDRTQPMIDAKIHEETKIFLKNNPVNGAKSTKGQKPRATKRQQASLQSSSTSTSSLNHQPTPPKQPPPNPLPKNSMTPNAMQPNYMQPNMLIPPSNQMQLPIHQQQQHPHQQQHRHPSQPNHQNTLMHRQIPLQQPMHNQCHQPQQQMIMHHNNILNTNGNVGNNNGNINMIRNNNGNMHYQPRHLLPQTSAPFNHNSMNNHYSLNNNAPPHQTMHQGPVTSLLPNDLDLNTLHGGLECDVESVIKHELSVEGQLDFNFDLLHQLDRYNVNVNNYF